MPARLLSDSLSSRRGIRTLLCERGPWWRGVASERDAVDVAERFFASERRMWRGYAVMAIRDKAARDDLYGRWRSEGRSTSVLIDSLADRPLAWSKT